MTLRIVADVSGAHIFRVLHGEGAPGVYKLLGVYDPIAPLPGYLNPSHKLMLAGSVCELIKVVHDPENGQTFGHVRPGGHTNRHPIEVGQIDAWIRAHAGCGFACAVGVNKGAADVIYAPDLDEPLKTYLAHVIAPHLKRRRKKTHGR